MKLLSMALFVPTLLVAMQENEVKETTKQETEKPQVAQQKVVYARDLSANDNFFLAYMLATPERKAYAKQALFSDPEFLKKVNK